MQKKLIALAIAGLASGAAFAQTNVTVYGIADAGYVYSSGGTPSGTPGTYTFSGVNSGLLSGSRLGFKGEEALGNGLKAIFTLEYGLSIDTNAGVGTSLARQQFVGLSSDKLGTASFGRQYAPAYNATINADALVAANNSPLLILDTAAGNTIQGSSNARWNNSISYTSPNFSGFTGKAIYGFGESSLDGYNNASTSDNGLIGVGGNYANGPLNIDLVYQSRQNNYTGATYPIPTGYGKDINEYFVGASYDFKMAKVFGSYQATNDKNVTNMDSDIWGLGVSVPVMAASSISLSYAQLDWDQGYINAGAPGYTVPGVKGTNGNTNAWGLLWQTNMSKRTTVYAGYSYVDNDKNATAASQISGVGALGESNYSVMAGMRHAF
ncbi:MAG TPA: porin [Accumulibacter sp.]|nr:porin [Accumulibacter sp.]